MRSLHSQRVVTVQFTRPPLPEGEEITKFSTNQIHRLQLDRGESPCFRSDARYTCQQQNCPLGFECRRRIAAWLR